MPEHQLVLEEHLGLPGSHVYRAIHLQTRQSAVIKFLVDECPRTRNEVADFARELELLQTLRHPNVVRCFGGGIYQGEPFIGYEFIKGASLAAILRRRGKLPFESVVDCAVQICAGIEYARHRGLVHGRLSPDQVLISDDGQVKIRGFRRHRFYRQELPLAAGPLEQVAYLAPEQIRGEPASHRSDLYALGCMLFEMISGQRPFPADTSAEMNRLKLAQVAPKLRSLVLECPLWLEAAVAELLEADPERRPDFASAVGVALIESQQKEAARMAATVHAISESPSAIRAAPELRKARKLLQPKKAPRRKGPIYEQVWFLALCLLVIAAPVVWVFWPLSEAELYSRAAALMASDDKAQWQVARDRYLTPLLERYPNGAYAQKAQEFIDQIEMEQAESRLRMAELLGRPPRSEAERLFIAARKFQDFGDARSARRRYQAIIDQYQDDRDERPFVNLSRQRIAQIDEGAAASGGKMQGGAEFLESQLLRADELLAAGQRAQADQLLLTISSLYRDDRELMKFVELARQRLYGEGRGASLPTHQTRRAADDARQ
jgi:hypothetical protein